MGPFELLPMDMLKLVDKHLNGLPAAKHALSCTNKQLASLSRVPKLREAGEVALNRVLCDELALYFSTTPTEDMHQVHTLLAYINELWWVLRERPVLTFLLACLRKRCHEGLQLISPSDNDTIAWSIDTIVYRERYVDHNRKLLTVIKQCCKEMGHMGDMDVFAQFGALLNHGALLRDCVIQGIAESDNLSLMLSLGMLPIAQPKAPVVYWDKGNFVTRTTPRNTPASLVLDVGLLSILIQSASRRCLEHIISLDAQQPWAHAWQCAIQEILSVPMLALVDLMQPMGQDPTPSMFLHRLFTMSRDLVPDDKAEDRERRLLVFMQLYQKHPTLMMDYIRTAEIHAGKCLAQWMDSQTADENPKTLGTWFAAFFTQQQLQDILTDLVINPEISRPFVPAFLTAYYEAVTDRSAFRQTLHTTLSLLRQANCKTSSFDGLFYDWLLPQLDELQEVVLSTWMAGAVHDAQRILELMQRGRVDISHVMFCHKALISAAAYKQQADPTILRSLEQLGVLFGSRGMLTSTMVVDIIETVVNHVMEAKRREYLNPTRLCWLLRLLAWYNPYLVSSNAADKTWRFRFSHQWSELLRCFGACEQVMRYLNDVVYQPANDVCYWRYMVAIHTALFEHDEAHVLPDVSLLPTPSLLAMKQWQNIVNCWRHSPYHYHDVFDLMFLYVIHKKDRAPPPWLWIQAHDKNSRDYSKLFNVPPPDDIVSHVLSYTKAHKTSINGILALLLKTYPETLMQRHEDTQAALRMLLLGE